jgi:hypothetical protein
MYHRLHTATREIDLGTPTVGNETLSGWYWRELTSEDYGVIVTQLHYRLLANKLLAESDEVPTAVVLDQFYKNAQLPLPAQPEVVARAIQLGVEEGALGLAETGEGEIEPETLKFDERVALDAVDFGPGQVLLSRERAEAILAAHAEPVPVPGEEEGQLTPEWEGTTVDPPTPPDAVEPEAEGEVEVPPAEKRFHRLRLTIADVPAGRIGDVNRGIFIPLSNLADGGLTLTLELDITSDEGIPEATLEQKVKETIRQIGARVVREEKG